MRNPGAGDVLVSGKPTEHGLPQQTDKSVPAVFADAGVGEPFASRLRKAESIVKLAIGKSEVRGLIFRAQTVRMTLEPAFEFVVVLPACSGS
jgi:hypothetical protein